MDNDAHPSLVVGPLLRHVDDTSATIWVETARPGTVAVLGRTAETVTVHGHHYALVVVDGLEPGTTTAYTVELDGVEVWPTAAGADLPASTVRTQPAEDRVPDEGWKILFGSCRRIQHDDDDPHPDALRRVAERLIADPSRRVPDLLLLLGDQVYACQVPPRTQAFIDDRRTSDGEDDPPQTEVADFEEFAQLYAESWTSDPAVRWLLSTVPSAMIFDDHDIIDDWNISASWVEDMRRHDWWRDRVVGGLMAYWLYQHLGNLPPDELEADSTWADLRAAEGDAGDWLQRTATSWDRGAQPTPGARWSHARRLGGVSVVLVDSRNGRVLDPGHRDVLDEGEWTWLRERTGQPARHVLIASSLPILLPRGIHDAEAWNERLCDGLWGRAAARGAEVLRRAADLEHWAAFQRGFQHMSRLVADIADGRHGTPPVSVVLLSGDVHYAYAAEVRTGPDQRAAVWQVTCSPMHYMVETSLKAIFRAATSTTGRLLGRGLGTSARAPSPDLDWTVTDGPEFGSFLGTLRLDPNAARVAIERADVDGFTTIIDRDLTAVAAER